MVDCPDIAAVAKLVAEPARAQMLLRLLNGRALTATELAHHANVSPSTASSHLSRLRGGNLLTLEKQGRHRYYRLSGPGVAQVIEALLVVAPEPSNSRPTQNLPTIQMARTCYDHLAGRLGVTLADSLVAQGWLAPGDDYHVTTEGESHFLALGLDLHTLRKQRRRFARPCLDWTERRHHVAGALGAALAQMMFDRGWLIRNRPGREVHVTNSGYRGLLHVFGVRL